AERPILAPRAAAGHGADRRLANAGALRRTSDMRAHENPYRVSRVEALGFRGSESVAHLAATVRSHEYRGVIVGPEGSGKSTLLRELAGIIVADGVRVRIARFDDVAALASALVQRAPVSPV